MLTRGLCKLSRGMVCYWQSQKGMQEQGIWRKTGMRQVEIMPVGHARCTVEGQLLWELGDEVGGDQG